MERSIAGIVGQLELSGKRFIYSTPCRGQLFCTVNGLTSRLVCLEAATKGAWTFLVYSHDGRFALNDLTVR